MPEKQPLYSPEQAKEERRTHIELSPKQEQDIRFITLGIEEVDPEVRELAVEDVIQTLQNGHPLSRIVTGKEGELQGYIACEDFIPHEAYVKYLGGSGMGGRNLFLEVPRFLKYAKEQGYVKVNFHGWNERLNKALERFGFHKVRTDTQGDLSADFYEIDLQPKKTQEDVSRERQEAFENKYLAKLNRDYETTLATFSEKAPKDAEGNPTGEPSSREVKTRLIEETYRNLSVRLAQTADFTFGDIQKAVLKLKLARYFQNNDVCDLNTLYDALRESPKFLNTDKGSLHRLFETHEQKTLQKIAEMRRKRAEMTGEERFNPFEWVYQTEDHEYALARLLNMPHLEEESEYMNHCVGTSNSYINKMKRGEVEIFSVRIAPKVDEATGKLTQDTPVLTIEYNVKTGVIEQMKKNDDEYLSPNDPYYKNVIEILKALRASKLDTGKPRTIRSIAKSETQHFPDPKQGYILTDEGEVSWEDYDPKSELLVLKTSSLETSATTPRKILAKMLVVLQGINVEPIAIARTLDEIDNTTCIYVGELQPGFFGQIPDSVEHIYTSPDRKEILRQTIEVGGRNFTGYIEELKAHGLSSMEKHEETKAWLERIDAQGIVLTKETRAFVEQLVQAGVNISDQAKAMMEHEDFQKSLRIEDEAEPDWRKWKLKPAQDMDFIRLSVADLNIQGVPTTDTIYARAQELGLELVPPEACPTYRLATLDQAMDDWVYMGMKQISDTDGSPRVFSMDRGEGGLLWLNGTWVYWGIPWDPCFKFVFRLRPAEPGKQV